MAIMKNLKNNRSIQLIAWLLYDFANSANNVIIQTFIFASYFVSKVAPNKIEGATHWGIALGITGLVVAILGPVLGAIVDQEKKRKKWLVIFTTITVLSIGLMWFVLPSSQYQLMALILVAIAAGASEIAFVFYNGMLPELAPAESLGRWSGWGWASGYMGGIIALLICLLFFIDPILPLFNFDSNAATGTRASFLFAALWLAFFSLPIFIFIPFKSVERRKFFEVVQSSLKQLMDFFSTLASQAYLVRFLIARMFFIDALITLFAFGGVYASAQFNMSGKEILLFGIMLNVTAGIGAALFAFIDDLYGGKKVIIAALIGLIISGTLCLVTKEKGEFWFFASMVGLFVGPAQASSRSFFARIVPPKILNQMFGFFALSSRITAFFGPLSVSLVTYLTGSLRLGMGMIIVLLSIGLLLMFRVPADK